jgi:hypothetical protein
LIFSLVTILGLEECWNVYILRIRVSFGENEEVEVSAVSRCTVSALSGFLNDDGDVCVKFSEIGAVEVVFVN